MLPVVSWAECTAYAKALRWGESTFKEPQGSQQAWVGMSEEGYGFHSQNDG